MPRFPSFLLSASLHLIDFLISDTPEVRRSICSWITFFFGQQWELAELPNSHPDFSLRSEVRVAVGLRTPSFDLILSLPSLLQLTKLSDAGGVGGFSNLCTAVRRDVASIAEQNVHKC